jgi:hypothetical protein
VVGTVSRPILSKYMVSDLLSVELFDFEACLRVREFQFTRGSALYRE